MYAKIQEARQMPIVMPSTCVQRLGTGRRHMRAIRMGALSNAWMDRLIHSHSVLQCTGNGWCSNFAWAHGACAYR